MAHPFDFRGTRAMSRDLEVGPDELTGHRLERAPTIAEDVTIPAHLLRTVADNQDWTPDVERRRRSSAHRTDPPSTFDVQRVAARQAKNAERVLKRRAASISVGVLGRNRAQSHDPSAITVPRLAVRKTSLPAVQEAQSDYTKSLRSSKGASGDFSKFTTPHASGDFSNAEIQPLPSPPADDAILYKNLHNFSFKGWSSGSGSGSGSTSSVSEEDNADPMFVVPGEKRNPPRRVSILDPEPNLTRVETMPSGEVVRQRRGTIDRAALAVQGALQSVTDAVADATYNLTEKARRSSMYEVYEKAKKRQQHLQRKYWVQVLFEVFFYLILLSFVYFVLVGRPLWKGAVWWLWWVVQYKFVVAGGWSITIGLAVIYAFTPLLIFFEPDPPMPDPNIPADPTKTPGVHDTGLMIPCYKSENIVGATLEAAIKIFPPSHIFVIANGNSPTPLDNTEAVCQKYGVNHVWSPVGSKIVAQFVGCYAMKGFKNVLLIDDDCALPPNFPIVSDRMKGKVGCLGYTIKSVGPNSSKGTLAQRAQDLEYRISGLQRALAGKIGSATFPHGAISLWNREFLLKTFHTHPGFSVSEDWFFGHVARQLGCRIKMCTSVFVETETPDSVFVSSGGSRGGFGEMTIFKQRFSRWNFFFVNGMYYNLSYIIFNWKLGWWEFGAKLFVFQEIYETLLYLIAPFMLPISFIVRPVFSGTLFSATFGLYFLNVTIFNEIHLRRKHERVYWVCVYLYYMPYKILLTAINVASCYWSLYKYAKYFAKRHPKIIEDEKAVEVVLRLEESGAEAAATVLDKDTGLPKPSVEGGRRMTITAIGTRLSVVEHNADLEPQISKVTSRRSSRGGRRPSGARRSNSIANRYSISYDTKNSFDRPTYGDEIEPDSELARRLRAMEQRQQSVAQSVSGPKPTTAAVDFAAGSFGAPSPASPMERVHENFELGPSDFTSHLEQVREDVEEPDEEFPRPYNTAAVDFENASPSPFDRLHEALSLPPRPPLDQALDDAELGPRDNRRKTSFARSPV